ncbi:hypothetical protein ACQ4LE_006958 [Meloidogyne hapla]
MGICQSQEEKDLETKTKQIDRDLLQVFISVCQKTYPFQSHIAHQKIVKLLLLGEFLNLYLLKVIAEILLNLIIYSVGAGECGKSTILKQMRILHDHGFTEEEKEKQKFAVYNNTGKFKNP